MTPVRLDPYQNIVAVHWGGFPRYCFVNLLARMDVDAYDPQPCSPVVAPAVAGTTPVSVSSMDYRWQTEPEAASLFFYGVKAGALVAATPSPSSLAGWPAVMPSQPFDRWETSPQFNNSESEFEDVNVGGSIYVDAEHPEIAFTQKTGLSVSWAHRLFVYNDDEACTALGSSLVPALRRSFVSDIGLPQSLNFAGMTASRMGKTYAAVGLKVTAGIGSRPGSGPFDLPHERPALNCEILLKITD